MKLIKKMLLNSLIITNVVAATSVFVNCHKKHGGQDDTGLWDVIQNTPYEPQCRRSDYDGGACNDDLATQIYLNDIKENRDILRDDNYLTISAYYLSEIIEGVKTFNKFKYGFECTNVDTDTQRISYQFDVRLNFKNKNSDEYTINLSCKVTNMQYHLYYKDLVWQFLPFFAYFGVISEWPKLLAQDENWSISGSVYSNYSGFELNDSHLFCNHENKIDTHNDDENARKICYLLCFALAGNCINPMSSYHMTSVEHTNS